MITDKDIYGVFEKDKSAVMSFSNRKRNMAIRDACRRGDYIVSRLYDFHTDNSDYVLSMSWNREIMISCIYAYCKEKNLYYAVLGNVEEGRDFGITAYTPHFFKRYALRACGKDVGLKDAIPCFVSTSRRDSIIVYYNDKNGEFAYANEMGLLLGKFDIRRSVSVFRTFVSYDMLGQSQKDTFCKVFPYLLGIRYGILKPSQEDCSAIYANVCNIYKQFYE